MCICHKLRPFIHVVYTSFAKWVEKKKKKNMSEIFCHTLHLLLPNIWLRPSRNLQLFMSKGSDWRNKDKHCCSLTCSHHKELHTLELRQISQNQMHPSLHNMSLLAEQRSGRGHFLWPVLHHISTL